MNVKQQQESEDGFSIDQQSFLQRQWRETKKTIFEFTFLMLQGERIPMLQRIALILIETFQILNFHFCEELESAWKNSSIVSGIRLILKFTSLYPYFTSGSDSSNLYTTYNALFYVVTSVFLVLFLFFIYIIVSLKRKNQKLSLLINLIRFSSELLVTILYLPLLQFFLSPLDCKTVNSILVHAHFPDVQCFGNQQIALVFLGLICSVLLTLYVGLMTLLFFSCRASSSDCCTKNSGRGEFCLFVLKLALVLFYNFLIKQGYEVIFIVLMLIGSFLLFEHYQFNLTYHDIFISKLITAQHSINLWTTLILILGKLTENYQFDGACIVWILGVPFVYIIVLMRSEQRYDILLINTNQYDVLSDPMRQLQYVTKLLCRYTKDKHIQIMLDGFLDHHRNTCILEDCPSKRRLTKTTKFSKALRNEKVSEQLIMIYTVIQSMYYFALQKFPNNTKIRILYALYLVDTMRSSQQALQELLNAESERPIFDEEFIIFRYKQVIENDLMENNTTLDGQKDQSGSSDIVNELSVQNHERICRGSIEKSTMLHVEFWSQLSEEHPDLGKLSELGYKISVANSKAEEQWNRLDRINTHIPSLMRVYARFLSEIINDKDGSINILKKLIDINFKNQNSNKINNLLDLSTDSRPSIVISAEDDSFGLVANINLAAASLSGYSKMEILNRNVSALMPILYGRHHDQFLESYLSSLEPRILNTERILPLKNKQGYISPMLVLVRHVPSLIHGLQFVSSFRVNRNLKEVCQIIVNKEFNIENVSTTCIVMLKIDVKKLLKKEIPVLDCIPSYKENIAAFQEKNGAVATVQDCGRHRREFQAKITATEISFRNLGHQGYILRIEKIPEGELSNAVGADSKVKPSMEISDQKQLGISSVKKSKIKKPPQLSQFMCIRFDIHTSTYLGENIIGNPSINEDDGGNNNNNDSHSNIFSTISVNGRPGESLVLDKIEEKEDEKNTQKQFENYGKGIRTVRMINSQFVDLEDLRLKEEEAEEDILGQENQDEEEERNNGNNGNNFGKFRQDDLFGAGAQQDSNDSGNVFKKKSAFVKFIEQSRFLYSAALEKFRTFVFIFIVLVAVFSAINHLIITSQIQQVNERVKLETYSTIFAANGQRVVSKALNIYLYKKSIFSTISSTILKDMDTIASEMKTVNDYIELSGQSISSSFDNFLSNKQILLHDVSTTQQQNLKLANQQILAKLNNLIGNTAMDQFMFTNTDFYFLIYNEMNDYYSAVQTRSNYYMIELQNWSSSQQDYFVLYLTLSIIWSLICFIGLFPFYILINKAQQQILTIFLDIPLTKINRCENFLACLQGSNEDDTSSALTDMLEEEEQSLTTSNIRRRTKKRRNFRINLKNEKNFFLPFLIIVIVFESYFAYSFAMSKGEVSNIASFLSELNTTTNFEAFYGFSFNTLQLLLIDSTFPVASSSSSVTQLSTQINEMYTQNNEIQRQHSDNQNLHESTYNTAYNQIMMTNTCQMLSEAGLLTQIGCEQFAEKSLQQGLALSLSRHIENLIQIYTQYVQAKATTPDMTAKNKALLNSNEFTEISTMQDIYIRVMVRYLVEKFKDSINDGYDSNQTIRITILILCIVLIFILYLAIWIPVLNTISREIVRIRSMVYMVPLETIASVKSIKEIFSPFLTSIYAKE